MLLWSENVMKQADPLIPVRVDAKEFVPSERAFPFADTQKVMSEEDEERYGREGKIVPSIGNDSDTRAHRLHPFIEVGEDYVTFRMQRGPIRERGVNGCQIDDLVKFVADTIAVLNKKFPCRENSLTITKLEEAWLWLQACKIDREIRRVEGYDKE